MARKTKDDDTDPKLPAIHPEDAFVQPTIPLEIHINVIPPHRDISGFSGQLERLMLHANEQAQVESDYQSRWADWKKDLEVVWRKVKSHA